MRRVSAVWVLVCGLCVAAAMAGCGSDDPAPSSGARSPATPDAGSVNLAADVDGSVQNPAWSPDGDELLVTVWRGGYNIGPADLLIVPIEGGKPRTLLSDGRDNVNLPGSAWNSVTNRIVYSSTEDPHDEIWTISAGGDDKRRVTLHDDHVAYEPSWSPDGEEIVFELHPLDVEGEGRIVRSPADRDEDDNVKAEVFLTPKDEDCRQPNWSAEGDLIVFQCTTDGGESWALWVSGSDGTDRRKLDTDDVDATDASFSPDGDRVVFSGARDGGSADLWIVKVDGGELVQLTDTPGYEGAPSWSPDGQRVAFEASEGDPDGDRTSVRIVTVDHLG